MSDSLSYNHNFVGVYVFEAVCETGLGAETLLIESRISASGKLLLFTVVNGQPMRGGSIQDLVLSYPQCLSLSIGHTLHISWNNAHKKAEVYEIYVPSHSKHNMINMKVRLHIDHMSYETEECETLTEAIGELKTLTGPQIAWWFQTCHHCLYSYPAFRGPGWDDRDHLRCYRDAPNELVQVQQKGQKFVDFDTMYAGSYFVNAFHTCAAWQPPTAGAKDL
jgi:hypothetical protein